MVSLHDQMAIQWAKTNCTVESNLFKSEKHFYILKECPFLFHLIAGFHCSFAVVPGISHLAYTHTSGPHSCKRSAFTTVRESIKEKERDVKRRFLEI